MMTDSIMQEYTQYMDASDMIIEYYKNQTTAGLEKHFLTIEAWLNKAVDPEHNRPLVIQAEEGVGKKTLLAQWMKYHQQKSQKNYPDLIISHFAGTGGNSANYYYALYKILVRLRENFNISQKVEIVEEKLTRYFNYWLDISSKALATRVVDDSTIILVFDSVNLFIDPDTNEESNIALWFPSTFPEGIKVIVTVDPGSQSFRRFQDLGCEVIKVEREKIIPDNVITSHLNRPSYITDDVYKKSVVEILQAKAMKNYLFLKTYLSTLLPYPSDHLIKESDINKSDFLKVFKGIDFTKLKEIDEIDELTAFILDYFSKVITDAEKFKKIMCALTLTQKGLTEQELLDLVKIEVKEWKYVIAIFKTFFMTYKGLWKINNEAFKKAIYNLYLQKSPAYAKQIHDEISDVLVKTPNSLRKLEEETYQLNGAQSYFKLKEAVSSIENFLLLFNPNTKYELCRYWQILEHKGFDPASEYTKSIEGFELHYRPNPEDTFMIILQVSRFLKEFSDFETGITPDFRHPPIKGGKEMKEIGLRREIKKLGIFVPENWEEEDDKNDDMEEIECDLVKEFPDYTAEMIKDLTSQIYTSTQKKRREDADKEAAKNGSEILTTQGSDEGRPSVKSNKKTSKRDPPILSAIEMLNVDIPENRERFKAFYLGNKSNKEEEEAQKKQQTKTNYLDDDDAPTARESRETETENSSYRTKSGFPSGGRQSVSDRKEGQNPLENQVVLYDAGYAELSKGDFQPTYYYYKRWLWIMFPWVCMSYKKNYSNIIYECFASATKYVSVPDEREIARHALKIAIEAKLKKQLILAKPSSDNNDVSVAKIIKTTGSTSVRGKKTLPPIYVRDEKANLSSKREALETEKSLSSSRLSGTKRDELATIVAARSPRKLQEHHFFITNEFLNTSNFNSSNKSSEIYGSGRDISITNISAINREGNRSVIQEKTLLASERRFEQTLQKSNDSLKALLLPRYQDSVISYSEKQVDELNGKVQSLSVQLNEIVYQTKTAAKKLKDLSVIEVNLKGTNANDIADKERVRVNELEGQLVKAEKMKHETMKQKDRLESLIHICFKNKKEDELYIRSLNYLITSFKKIIKWEREATYENLMKANDLEKLSQQYGKAYEDKMQTYEMMISHVKDEKQATRGVDKKVTLVYSSLERSANEAVENLKAGVKRNDERERRKTIRLSILRDNQLAERENLDEKREVIEQIREKIGLDHTSPNFQGFMEYIEKLSDFERGIFQTSNDINKLKEQKKFEEHHLETLKKARAIPKTQIIGEKPAYDGSNSKEELQSILQAKKKKAEDLSHAIISRTKLILGTQMILNKIFGDIGVDVNREDISLTTPPVDKIQAVLEEKFKVIKEKVGEEDFSKFKGGKLEVDVYTKSSEEDGLSSSKSKTRFEKKGGEQIHVFKQGRKYMEVGMHRMSSFAK